MKVKLQTGFWMTADYLVSVDQKFFTLTPMDKEKEKTFSIPLSELQLFSLSKMPNGKNHFRLEAENQVFEGSLKEDKDLPVFIEALRKYGYHYELNLFGR